MKCGSCKNSNAENYQKIKKDNNLFEILIKLNPRQAYSDKYSYFCGVCINLAKKKLSETVSTMSDHNVNSFTTLNMSTLSNSTNASESSKDEFDYLVMSKYVFSDTGTPMPAPQKRTRSKRPTNDTVKPCPKRFKPLVPIQLANISQTSLGQKSRDSISEKEMVLTVQQDASPVSLRPCPKRFKKPAAPAHLPIIQETSSVEDEASQAKSSESISMNEMFLNLEHDDSSVSSTSKEQHVEMDALQPSVASVEQQVELNASPVSSVEQGVTSDVRVTAKAVHTQPKVRNKPRAKAIVQYDSDSLSSADPHTSSRQTTVETSNRNLKDKNPNQQAVTSDVQSDRVTAESRPKAIHRNKPRAKAIVQYDSLSSDEPNRQTTVETNNPNRQGQQQLTVQDVIAGPTAPAAKSPRVRQDNNNFPRDIREYFSTQNFNVNNYSRSLAG